MQEFAPSSLADVCKGVCATAQSLTDGYEMPSEKWLVKHKSEALKQCRS